MKINSVNLNFGANKVSKAQAKYFKDALKSSENVNIICHTGTDTDSISSAAVISSYLAQMGVKSTIISSKDVSKFGVLNPEKYNVLKEKDLKGDEKVEGTTICVDFSSKSRASNKALRFFENADKTLCIDHHRGINLSNHDYIYINSPLKNNNVKGVASYYVDSSAKSTTSIIYRFFEALNEDIDNETAYNMFLGLTDDGVKRGYIDCNGVMGKVELYKEAFEDENFVEVFSNLKEKLSEAQIENIAREVDRTANLTPEQVALKNFLYNNIQYDSDNKIAYVVIEPDNKIWKKAGGDTPTVSTIMNQFRQDILSNKDNKKENENTEIAMVFYKANGNYRVSLHSKNVNLHPVYEYIENNCPAKNISIGGHATRGGGRITTFDKNSCNLWVNSVLEGCRNNI